MKKTIDLFWIIGGLTFVVWVFCFRSFLLREAPLMSDAISFYDHLKFYIDNIVLGVYPFWDPLWSCGSPNELFLRRIGPFNPFLLLIAVPYKLGVSYWAAFSAFITIYFFLGMFGFYKLTLEILKDKNSALTAFVLLSLCSLGTRVFDSYMMMLMTPLIWFFYFLLVFSRSMQKYALAGAVFSVMLLMTTYIPFYFVVVVLTFGLFFVLIFPRESWAFLLKFLSFIKQHPYFFGLCFLALCLSCVPGYMFFKHAEEGSFAMPLRHFNAAEQNELIVKADVTAYWAIPEDLLFSFVHLEDFKLFRFAVLYVPIVGIVFLLIGILAPLTRKMVFVFVWAAFLFLMGSPYFVPVYRFLLEHVFFFKYFRNLHFFLWLVILPLFILFVVEQKRLFLRMFEKSPQKRSLLGVVIVAHLLAAGYLYWRGSFNVSTWVVLGLSLLIFVLFLKGKLKSPLFYGLLLSVVMIEPLEIYFYLDRNTWEQVSFSDYDYFSPEVQYTRGQKTGLIIDPEKRQEKIERRRDPLYYGTQWYNILWETIDYIVLKDYIFTKFILYDRVAEFDEQKQDMGVLQNAWAQKLNVAFVPPGALKDLSLKDWHHPSPSAPMFIEKPSSLFRVLRSDANSVKIATDIPEDKFLVFNDGYYPGWTAQLNGKPAALYRANFAFKGVFLPSGPQILEFSYGNSLKHQVEIILLVFYFIFFSIFLRLWRRGESDARDGKL